MHWLVAPALGVVLAAAAALPPNQALDGDTLEVEGQRVRLSGVDAFELAQTCLDRRGEPWRCGIAAKAALAELTQDQALTCTVLAEHAEQGYLARCTVRDGVDVGRYLVAAGLALAEPDADEDYRAVEAEARAARKGAWSGTFAPPWQWRQHRPDQ